MARRLAIAAVLLIVISAGITFAADAASIGWRYKVKADCIAVSKDGLVVVGSGAEVIAIGKDGQESWYWDAPAVVEHLEFGPKGEVFATYGSQITKLGGDG
jgi:hypothetical protein